MSYDDIQTRNLDWELIDRADGVDGHYCIGRINQYGWYEYYNNGEWKSTAEVFENKDTAIKVIRMIDPCYHVETLMSKFDILTEIL
jgi:hypothetical protein